MTTARVTADHDKIAEVDGWPINVADLDDAVARILDSSERGESFAAFTLNADHLVKLRTDAAFRRAYRQARFVTADGAPVARLASQSARRPVHRTTGADLVVPLAVGAAERRLPVYLFGTTPAVLGRAGAYLASFCDDRLDIVGTEAPAQGFDPAGAAADAALERIAASGARLCFLALGAPKQELLAARALAKGIPAGFVCIGAALDFLAGAQVRAPVVMQKNGLEWLWRLATNPRRLSGRYARCALVLADIAIRQPLIRPRRQPEAF